MNITLEEFYEGLNKLESPTCSECAFFADGKCVFDSTPYPVEPDNMACDNFNTNQP